MNSLPDSCRQAITSDPDFGKNRVLFAATLVDRTYQHKMSVGVIAVISEGVESSD